MNWNVFGINAEQHENYIFVKLLSKYKSMLIEPRSLDKQRKRHAAAKLFVKEFNKKCIKQMTVMTALKKINFMKERFKEKHKAETVLKSPKWESMFLDLLKESESWNAEFKTLPKKKILPEEIALQFEEPEDESQHSDSFEPEIVNLEEHDEEAKKRAVLIAQIKELTEMLKAAKREEKLKLLELSVLKLENKNL